MQPQTRSLTAPGGILTQTDAFQYIQCNRLRLLKNASPKDGDERAGAFICGETNLSRILLLLSPLSGCPK